MIKFEEHEGKLFIMLEKPVPLTDDTELPVLVRLIQDDTMLGKANKRRCHPDALAKKIICINLTDDGTFMDGNYTYRYEIIGYPVAEGSAEWALYQMMQGKKVCSKNDVYIRYLDQNKKVCLVSKNGDVYQGDCSPEDWLYYVESTWRSCWQIYHEPEPQYKVGDWVEYRLHANTAASDNNMMGQIIDIGRIGGTSIEVLPVGNYEHNSSLSTYHVIHASRIIRKLSPSEVIVKIGCLSGTVRPVSTNGIHIWFHLTGIDDRPIAIIRISCLDIRTRELVEDLLKAQDEEK